MNAQPPAVETHSAFLLRCAAGGGCMRSRSVEARRPEAEARGGAAPLPAVGEKGNGDVAAGGERGETGRVRGEATGIYVRFGFSVDPSVCERLCEEKRRRKWAGESGKEERVEGEEEEEEERGF